MPAVFSGISSLRRSASLKWTTVLVGEIGPVAQAIGQVAQALEEIAAAESVESVAFHDLIFHLVCRTRIVNLQVHRLTPIDSK